MVVRVIAYALTKFTVCISLPILFICLVARQMRSTKFKEHKVNERREDARIENTQKRAIKRM